MSTIDSKDVVRKLLENNGNFEGDPQAHSIWSYVNMEGRKTQAVYWNEYQVDIYSSMWVREPEMLWSQKRGLTPAGKLWLVDNKEKR